MNDAFDANTAKLFVTAAAFGWFIHPGYVIAAGAVYKGFVVASELMSLGGYTPSGGSLTGNSESLTNSIVDLAAIAAGAFAGRYIKHKTT